MGRNSKARRDARRRATGRPLPFEFATTERLLHEASVTSDSARRTTNINSLAHRPKAALAAVTQDYLARTLADGWENGWSPTELVRIVRMRATPGAVGIVELAVSADHTRRDPGTLDPRWIKQITHLALPQPEGPRWLASHASNTNLTALQLAQAAVDALHTLWHLPPLELLLAPPGRPDLIRADRMTTNPILEKIRNLLTKAESTPFEAESLALTAKAAELAARHAINDATLAAHRGYDHTEPTMTRIMIDAPYASAKSVLLAAVSTTHRGIAVEMTGLGMSTVIATPDDLETIETLYTSLLLQASNALAQAARQAPPGARTRSAGYRSAFLLGYANRVHARLEDIEGHIMRAGTPTGADHLPILAGRRHAVQGMLNEKFPNSVTRNTQSVTDTAGWVSGTGAADQAHLNAGDLDDVGEHIAISRPPTIAHRVAALTH